MVEIIAHRGARSLAPENTLAAARAGFDVGAHRWETDVSLTRDHGLVLFHDPDLLRCTDAKTRLDARSPGAKAGYCLMDFTLEEILQLDAGSFFARTDPFSTIARGGLDKERVRSFEGEPIPTLEQGLDLTGKLNWKINLELKDHGRDPAPFFTARQTLACIEKSGIPRSQVVISSFNHVWLDWVRKQDPLMETQALVGDDGDVVLDFKDFSFPGYNINADLVDDKTIAMLKKKGKKINLFTVNDSGRAAEFLAAGVDGIITDFPQNMMDLI